MKHFIGILAHKSPFQLGLLIDQLKKMNFAYAIHVDAAHRGKFSDLIEEQKDHFLNVSHQVKHGHFSIVEATVDLMKASMINGCDYFHLISGEDFPIKSVEEFYNFFTENDGFNFINHNKLPVKDADNEMREQIFRKYSVFKDRIPISNYKHAFLRDGLALVEQRQFPVNSFMKHVVNAGRAFRTYQRVHNFIFKRKAPKAEYHAGSAWFSITSDLVRHFLAEIKENPKFYNYFKHAGFPDEIFFHTLAMNSRFSNTIINSDLRYIEWNKIRPRYLDRSSLMAISGSNGFFARKWNFEQDPGMVELLQNKIINA